MDLSKLSDEDLRAVAAGNMSGVSEAGLRHLAGTPAPVDPRDTAVPPAPGSPEYNQMVAKQEALSAQPRREKTFGDRAGELWEDVKAVASPAVSSLIGGGEAALSVLSGIPGQLAGGIDFVGSQLAGQPLDTSLARKQSIEQALPAYQPQSDVGQQALEGVGNLASLPGKAGEAIAEPVRAGAQKLGASPETAAALATGVRMVPDVAATVMGAPKAKGAVKAAAETPLTKPKVEAPPVKTKINETPVESLRAAGYKFRPSDMPLIEPGKSRPISSTAEKFGGSESLRKSLLLKNQTNSVRLAAEELGLPKETVRITESALDKLRGPEIATYNEVGTAVGKFQPSKEFDTALKNGYEEASRDVKTRRALEELQEVVEGGGTQIRGPKAVETLSELRRRSAKLRRSEDVATQDMGEAIRDIANALEQELDSQLSLGPNKGLVSKFKASREKLAKIHDVETATSAGQVDAAVLERMRKRGQPLTGRLAIIADAAEHLPSVTAHASKVSTGQEGGLLKRTGEIATAGVRKALESDAFQNRLGKEAKELGPEAGLSDYFPKREQPKVEPKFEEIPPSGATSQNQAQRLSGDLEILPDQFPNAVEAAPTRARPSDLTIADDFVSEGVPFRGEQRIADDLAGDLELAPEQVAVGQDFVPPRNVRQVKSINSANVEDLPQGALDQYRPITQIRGGQHPVDVNLRAQSMAGDLGLEGQPAPAPVRTSRSDRDPSELTRSLSLGDAGPREKSQGPHIVDVGDDFFEIRTPGEKTSARVQGRQAAEEIAQDLIDADTDLGPNLAELEALAAKQKGPKKGAFGTAKKYDFENNASGESSASLEAQSRVKQEKEAGQQRFKIAANGAIVPLVGVDAVDAVAKKGEVIVQRGVGKNKYSVLDRGGLSREAAERRLKGVEGGLDEI